MQVNGSGAVAGMLTTRAKFTEIAERVRSSIRSGELARDYPVSEQAKPYGFLVDGAMDIPLDYFKERSDICRNTVFINKFIHLERIGFAKHALVDLVEAGLSLLAGETDEREITIKPKFRVPDPPPQTCGHLGKGSCRGRQPSRPAQSSGRLPSEPGFAGLEPR